MFTRCEIAWLAFSIHNAPLAGAQSYDSAGAHGCCLSLPQAKQRAEVLQSTHKFFSDQQQQQQQQLKAPVSKPARVDGGGKVVDNVAPNHQGGPPERTEAEKPPSLAGPKPVRTGPIKPQSIKPEESK